MSQPIEYLKGVGPLRADLLKKELGIFTYADLLHHFPFRHIDKTKVTPIAMLHPTMEYAQVKGRLIDFQVTGIKSGKRLTAYLKDETGVVELTWFRGLSWVEKNLQQGETYFAFGRVSFFMDKSATMVFPLPTSPCSKRFIWWPAAVSLLISLITRFCAPVSSNGRWWW